MKTSSWYSIPKSKQHLSYDMIFKVSNNFEHIYNTVHLYHIIFLFCSLKFPKKYHSHHWTDGKNVSHFLLVCNQALWKWKYEYLNDVSVQSNKAISSGIFNWNRLNIRVRTGTGTCRYKFHFFFTGHLLATQDVVHLLLELFKHFLERLGSLILFGRLILFLQSRSGAMLIQLCHPPLEVGAQPSGPNWILHVGHKA